MGFRLTPKETFSTLVTVPIANDKGGFDKDTFTATFLRPRTEQIGDLRLMSNEDLVRDRMTGWDMRDKDSGAPVEFSKEHLEALLAIPPSGPVTAAAFWDALAGARAKN